MQNNLKQIIKKGLEAEWFLNSEVEEVSFEICKNIFICWTFNFVFFMVRAIHKLPKYLFIFVILHIIWNPRIQVSTNMSIMVKPQNYVAMKRNNCTGVRPGVCGRCWQRWLWVLCVLMYGVCELTNPLTRPSIAGQTRPQRTSHPN